jgi:hypothetical protein
MKKHFSPALWYKQRSELIGWIGIALIAATFVSKEVLPEQFKDSSSEIEKAAASLDANELEERLNSARNLISPMSFMIVDHHDDAQIYRHATDAISAIQKLIETDGYYVTRIKLLERTEKIAKSGYLEKQHDSPNTLRSDLSKMRESLGEWDMFLGDKLLRWDAIKNWNEDVKAKVSDESYSMTLRESAISKRINDWSEAQRDSLQKIQVVLRKKAAIWSAVSYIVFFIGWMIAIADKASGISASAGKSD